MLLTKQSLGLLFMFGLLLVGCETTNPYETLKITAPVSSLKVNKTLQPSVAQAFILLKEGKYSEASSFINKALQSQPKSAILHILNALTYEKLAENGDPTGIELAIIGYRNAINLDPFNSFPIIQLGKLRYRDQKYDQAQEHFANALLLKPNDPDLIHEFAAASYYAYDIKSAFASIKRAEKLKPQDPLIQRSAAMIYAAIGDFKNAEKHFKLFQAKIGQDSEVTHVANRFNDWQSLYRSGRLTLVADQSSPEGTSTGKEDSEDKNPVSLTPSNQTESETPALEDLDVGLTVDTPLTTESEQPTKQEFTRGNEAASIVNAAITADIPSSGSSQGVPPEGPSGAPSGSLSGGSPGKPVPAAHPLVSIEEPEQQIIMDCYVLKILESVNTRKGNNILQSLAVTLNPGSFAAYKGSQWGSGAVQKGNSNASVSDQVTYTPDSGFATGIFDANGKEVNPISPSATNVTLANIGSISGQIFTRGITWAGLTYSLNIANASDAHVKIISRPTLMAFLRKEARFFSGEELVNVSGGNYGSNLSRYQIGVSLAVTPESLIGEILKLNIGIESSNLENINPNLLETISTDKTRVETTVRVRLGETIMLGGLYQREELHEQNGFPGLRDTPFLQYFFSRELTQNIRASVMILLTPRSPDTVKSAINRAMTRESVQPHFSELVARNPDWFNPNINAINAFNYINLDPLIYYEFRTGDILPPSWSYEPALSDKLAELSSFLYF